MSRTASAVAVATTIVVLGTAPVCADVDARLTLASNYVHRGIAQSDDRPVAQALVDVDSQAGFYAGIWASRVDYDHPADDREREIDYFAGFIARPARSLAFELGVVRNTFDGHAFGRNYDWTELQLTTHVAERWSFMVAAAEGWLGSNQPSYVLEAVYRHPLPWRLVADATTGWQLADEVIGQRYFYDELGLSRALGQFDLRVSSSATHAAELPGNLGERRWLFSIAWRPFAD